MSEKRANLENLAALVSDGKPVDWDQALSINGDLGASRTMENLAVLDTIIRSHHSLHNGPDGLSNWGSLRIVRHIASGSFGDVYRAYDANLDRDVALKLLRPELASSPERCVRLLQEGRNLARVQHENVATIYGAEQHDQRVGIWMELIEGDSLAELLETKGTYSADETVVIGAVLCRALCAVHAAGQAHGDIKAQNILREVGGRLVLTDFGSGSCLSDTDSLVSGTPLYLAPEILREDPIDAASDIYSLGILLFRLLSGRFPHEAETLAELRANHLRGPKLLLYDLCPDLSRKMIGVIEHATAPLPADRFQSVGEMEGALQECLSSNEHRTRKSRIWPGLAIVVVVALILVVGMVMNGGNASTYTVETQMIRSNKLGTLPVVSGAAVAPGDRLHLDFQASKDLYVYVLNQDDRGDAFVLFPLPGQSLTNPLPSGEHHRIPGQRDGQPYAWQVTSAGGVEHFLVITSPTALTELETTIARLSTATSGATALKADASALSVFRGVGGLVTDQPVPTQTSDDLFQQVGELYQGGQGKTIQGVWIKRIDLVNPVP